MKFFIILMVAISIAPPAYLIWIRPWQLRWGATDAELGRAMPGDDVVADPTFKATRALTINAQPEDIWPWILQIGYNRAGWYSYDWIDNLGRPSAERIIPELQHVEVGDLVPMGPGGFGLSVKAVEPGRSMLWWDGDGAVSWAWGALSDRRDAHTSGHPRTHPLRLDEPVDHLPPCTGRRGHHHDAKVHARHQTAGGGDGPTRVDVRRLNPDYAASWGKTKENLRLEKGRST